MNMVCYYEFGGKNRDRRVLRSQSDERYYAKDQFDAFDKGVLWDPTMPKVVERINNSPGRKKSSGKTTTRTTTKRRRTTARKG
jgi:hypothetical protein